MKDSPIQNTDLSKEDLQYFKEKLLSLQTETDEKISSLKDRLKEMSNNADDNQSAQDHHQGDIASAETEKKTILQSIEKNQEKLNQIVVALDRIENGNYGICFESGQKIQKGRLEAMPYAIRSVGMKT